MRLALAVAALVLLPVASADAWWQAVQSSPRVEVHFSEPAGPTARDSSLNAHLIRLIQNVPSGGSIRGAFFQIGAGSSALGTDVPAALRKAQSNGVTVQVLQDKRKGEPLGLPQGGDKRCDHFFFFPTVNSACNGDRPALMHSKFMLFSKTKDMAGTTRSSVVWIGSHNPVGGAGGAQSYNNAVVVYADATLFDGMGTRIWNHMWNAVASPPPWWGINFLDVYAPRGFVMIPSPEAHVYASPDTEDVDIVAAILANYAPATACHVRVMQNKFEARPAVVAQLRRLRQGGCAVDVLLQHKAGEPDPDDPSNTSAVKTDPQTVADLVAAGIPIRVATQRLIHDKVVLVYAGLGGGRAFSVITGSHNLGGGAHINDEVLLWLARPTTLVHQHYLTHFNNAWNAPGGAWYCSMSPLPPGCPPPPSGDSD